MAEMTKKELLELLAEISENNLDPKFTEFREEIIHRFHVISEDVISKVQLVGEGVVNLNEKLDRHIDENKREHQDILAAIKFSYAELDRRMTTLEAEMQDLNPQSGQNKRKSVS